MLTALDVLARALHYSRPGAPLREAVLDPGDVGQLSLAEECVRRDVWPLMACPADDATPEDERQVRDFSRATGRPVRRGPNGPTRM